MLKTVGRIVPGIEDRLEFCDLGTPLTNVAYVDATHGAIYGTEKGRGQVGPFALPVTTPVVGLYHCGASTLSHGVIGATMSGVAAARSALGCRIRDLLGDDGPELRVYPADDPAGWPEQVRRDVAARKSRAARSAAAAASA